LTVLLAERGWDDNVGQLPAHNVVSMVPECLLGSRIELSDPALMIDRHNAVQCRVENRCLTHLTLLQRKVTLPTLDGDARDVRELLD
jgi:hypothetical protein